MLLSWSYSRNYFASSDPHHGIQFIPSDILSGKSSGILFGISSDILSGISIWHSLWHVYLTFYLANLSGIPSGMSSDILYGRSSGHSIWHIF